MPTLEDMRFGAVYRFVNEGVGLTGGSWPPAGAPMASIVQVSVPPWQGYNNPGHVWVHPVWSVPADGFWADPVTELRVVPEVRVPRRVSGIMSPLRRGGQPVLMLFRAAWFPDATHERCGEIGWQPIRPSGFGRW